MHSSLLVYLPGNDVNPLSRNLPIYTYTCVFISLLDLLLYLTKVPFVKLSLVILFTYR